MQPNNQAIVNIPELTHPESVQLDLELFHFLLENTPDQVYFKDRQGRFIRVSRAVAEFLEVSNSEQVVGKTDFDLLAPETAQAAADDERRIIESGQPLIGKIEKVVHPDGRVTWDYTTKLPLKNSLGEIIGVCGINKDFTDRRLAQDALAEKTEMLRKKSQQIEEELNMARELQLAMLPQDFPTISTGVNKTEALKFYSFFMPSGAVSGDFFSVLQLSDTAVGIFICDVMGHDVRAALITAMLHALVEDLRCAKTNPGQLLSEINQALFKVFRHSGTTMFATALYLVADVAAGQLAYATAAHPRPLRLKRPAGTVEVLGGDAGGKNGPGLGLFRDSQYSTCRQSLNVGDMLVFYTDGLTEEEDSGGEIFGEERLAASIAGLGTLPPKELLAKVLDTVRKFSGHQEFSDDVCLLGVEVKHCAIGIRSRV